MSATPVKIWTREDAHFLTENGFPDAAKLQLVNGALIQTVKNRPHQIWLKRVQGWLDAKFGSAYVHTKTPIDVAPGDIRLNEPEPDLCVTREPYESYTDQNPGPKDLLLVVEISDSTLQFDLSEKAALYARASIPEYWVLNIQEGTLIVHREPRRGEYGTVTVLERPTAPDKPFTI